MSTPLKVSPIGLSNTDQSVLKVALSLIAKTEVETELLTEQDHHGNILIVDLDEPKARQFLKTFSPSSQVELLLISSGMVEELHYQHFLHKPIRVQTVKDILLDILQEMSTTPNSKITHYPALPTQSTPQTKTAFNPNKNLFFVLLKIQKEKKAAQIYCPPYSALFVNGMDNIVATSATKEILWKITHLPNTDINSLQLSLADFAILAKGQRVIPLKNILWTTALYLSQGQIAAPEVTMDTPVQLKVWPNFSRLDFEPEHMQLTTLMTVKSLTLKQLVEQTQFPTDFVIGFFNAIWFLDLVAIKPTQIAITNPSSQIPIKSSLLQKIANRLKLNNI